MRPLAQVDEAVVLVHADFSVLDFVVAVFVRALLGELFDLVDLVVLFAIAEERERLGHGHVTGLERRVLLHDLAHLRFDLPEILGGQRAREVEVVVKAVLDGRPEAELRLREEIEDRTGHDVRGRMPQRVELFVAVVRFPFRFRHPATPKQKSPPSWDER